MKRYKFIYYFQVQSPTPDFEERPFSGKTKKHYSLKNTINECST